MLIILVMWCNTAKTQCVDWQPISVVNAPPASSSYKAVWMGDKMMVWSGLKGALYNPVNDQWSNISLVNAPNGSGIMVWTGTEVIIYNGSSGGRYNPLSDTWQSMASASIGDMYANSVWTGSVMLHFRHKYDPIADTWTELASVNAPPSTLIYYGQVWTGTDLIIWGGWDLSTNLISNIGYRYNLQNDTSPRALADVIWTDNGMFVWGGYNSSPTTYFTSGGLYDPISDTWQPTSNINVPSSRYLFPIISTGDKVIIWGGLDRTTRGRLGNGKYYDIETDTWHTISMDGAPSPRYWHSAAWTGSQMVLWSGSNLPQIANGARYSLPNSSPIVKIGHINYNSLVEAIDNSSVNDTIEVTTSFCEDVLSTVLPAGITLIVQSPYSINLSGTLTNQGTIINNSVIEANNLDYINNGSYKGSGTFNGNFVNHGSVVPGSN